MKMPDGQEIDEKALARIARQIVPEIEKLLVNQPMPLQGYILGDLLARWLFEHPHNRMDVLLSNHVEAVVRLIELKQVFRRKGGGSSPSPGTRGYVDPRPVPAGEPPPAG